MASGSLIIGLPVSGWALSQTALVSPSYIYVTNLPLHPITDAGVESSASQSEPLIFSFAQKEIYLQRQISHTVLKALVGNVSKCHITSAERSV